MKVLFDLMPSQPIKETKFHGGGEYCKAIFYEMVNQMDDSVIIEVSVNESVLLDPIIRKICEDKKIKIHDCKAVHELSDILNEGEYDVFYSALPYSYGNITVPAKTKFIYTIHGLRSLEMPYEKVQMYYGGNSLKNVLKRIISEIRPDYWDNRSKEPFEKLLQVTDNRKIITVSEHSKYALLYFFPNLEDEEIEVLYSPAKDGYFESRTVSQPASKDKYILLISGDRWIKNDMRAVLALDSLYTTHYEYMREYKVVLLGATNKSLYSNVKNPNYFDLRGYVESEDLEKLYKEATLFVYPTLNEGFGYPPLEAMKYGVPCVCSAISSTTEICGDAVFYTNPFSVKEIATRILEALKCGVSKRERIEKQYNYIRDRQNTDLKRIVEVIINGE